MRRIPRSWLPFYPVLLAGIFVLDLYVAAPEVTQALPRPLIAAMLAGLAVQAVASLLLRDAHKGAWVAAVVVSLVTNLPVVAGILVVAAAAPGWVALARRRPTPAIRWPAITRYGNAITALIVLLTVVRLFGDGLLDPTPTIRAALGPADRQAPDIYVILADGHARSDTLATTFEFDERPFLTAMTDLGFSDSPESRSNYNMTVLTLASMFQMRDLADVPAFVAASATGPNVYRAQYQVGSDLIATGPALDLLHEHGYEVVTMPSESTGTAILGADRYFDSGELTEFETGVLHGTLGRYLLAAPIRAVVAGQRRERVERSLAGLGSIAGEASERPRFVFAHLSLPHLPPAYGPQGQEVDGWPCFPVACDQDTLGWNQPMADRVAAMRDQVRWADQRLLETVAEIQARSVRPPVILVLSDHGSRYDPADHAEMFRSMFLASTPGHPGLFGASPGLVNLMPTLLNAYLGTSLPMATDRTHFLDIGAIRERGLFDLQVVAP